MEAKHLMQLILGSFSLVLAILLLQGFEVSTADPITAVITLLIAFFLVFISAVLFVAVSVSLSREI